MELILDNLKICTVCKLSKNSTDFLFNKFECYKCVYKEKLKKIDGKLLVKKCKLCKEKVPKTRSIYCSSECCDKAKKKRKHWSFQLTSDTTGFRKRFNCYTIKPDPENED